MHNHNLFHKICLRTQGSSPQSAYAVPGLALKFTPCCWKISQITSCIDFHCHLVDLKRKQKLEDTPWNRTISTKADENNNAISCVDWNSVLMCVPCPWLWSCAYARNIPPGERLLIYQWWKLLHFVELASSCSSSDAFNAVVPSQNPNLNALKILVLEQK